MLIVLKVSNSCNLKCKHCYEFGRNDTDGYTYMPLATLQRVFELAQSEYDHVTYLWFGGEPLLCGLEYFKEAIQLQKRCSAGKIIDNRIQTNGTLLDTDFSRFFIQEDFSVSVSYDGPYNNILRQKTADTLRGISLFKEQGGKCGILSTIHAGNVDKQIEMYEHIKMFGCSMKFNPIFASGNAINNNQYLLDVESYVNETARFFEYWCEDVNAVPVSHLIHYVRLLLNLPGRNCTFGKCFYNWIDIEPNGDILPCSRFSGDDYIICSLFDLFSFESVFSMPKYNAIVEKALIRRLACRENCPVYTYCNGGCNSAAANETGLENSGSQQCQITKELLPKIRLINDELKSKGTIKNPILRDILSQA